MRIHCSRCRAYGALGRAPLSEIFGAVVAVCKENGVPRVTNSVADFIYTHDELSCLQGFY